MTVKRTTVISNLIWRLAERFGAQAVLFIVTIALARLLTPEDYGEVALVAVFTTILNVFVDSGLGNALIQKKDADELDFSTVFLFNMAICIALYAAAFFAAPYIASFYGDPSLTAVLRVLSITLIISGLKNVQQAYVSRNMLFRKFFFSTIGGTIGAGIVGIAMAYRGYGVWALVAQQLFNAGVDTTILWITVRWRPSVRFSVQRFRRLFSFGWKLLAADLLDTFYNQLRSLLIGKIYTTTDLACYDQAKRIPDTLVDNLNIAIDSVLFPALANEQDHAARVKNMTRQAIRTSAYILAPMMMGLFFVAESAVRLVLTEKWLGCVFYLRIFCLTYIFYPIHTANLNAIKAMGKSGVFLKLELLKKGIGLLLLLITLPISVKAMAWSLFASSLASQIINSMPSKKLLGYGYLQQLRDILPSIALAAGMGIVVIPIGQMFGSGVCCLLLQIAAGAAVYLAGSAVFGLEQYRMVRKTSRL